ncbi:MAG TPA: response regulator [Vicinamibacterales bacterium]|nr:response regulator [Vicinamibacterales bacterium]
MQILVSDDEKPIAELLSSVCARGGHRVAIETSPEGVLAYLGRHALDLLIVDLDMPGPAGLGLVRAARALQSDLPIVAMTTQLKRYLPEDVVAAGAIDLLCKPFSMDDLAIRLALLEERLRFVQDLALETGAAAARRRRELAPAAEPPAGRPARPVLLFDRLREQRRGAA